MLWSVGQHSGALGTFNSRRSKLAHTLTAFGSHTGCGRLPYFQLHCAPGPVDQLRYARSAAHQRLQSSLDHSHSLLFPSPTARLDDARICSACWHVPPDGKEPPLLSRLSEKLVGVFQRRPRRTPLCCSNADGWAAKWPHAASIEDLGRAGDARLILSRELRCRGERI